MQLLAPCWPSELSARAELSRNLSQILGDDHDLAQLVKLVSTPTMVFASPDGDGSLPEALPQAAEGAAARGADTWGETVRRAAEAVR